MTGPASPFVEGSTNEPIVQQTTTEPTVTTSSQVVTPVPTITVPDSAKELIGDGKKYANVEAALAALPHAQEHITKLETENAQQRDELTRSKTAEELLEEIRNQQPAPEATPVPQIDMSVVEQMVEQKLTATEAQKIAQDNTKAVVDKLTDHYGSKDKANEVYIEQANALGLGIAGLNQLAATSPEAVFKMLGVSKDTTIATTHTTSTVNVEALNTQVQEPVKPRSLMGGATSKDAIAAWNAVAESINTQ